MRAKMVVVLAAVAISMSFAAGAQAGFLYNWDVTPTQTDPVDNSLPGGRDISPGVWVAQDADYYYFRMDLRETPTAAGNNYSGLYGIYIDALEGEGAGGGDTDYLPTGLSGIDFILDSHFNNSGTGGWEDDHFHYGWNGAGFQIGSVYAAQQTENAGKTAEWQIERSLIGDEFSFWAATHDVGSSAPTYDFVPDPNSPGIPVPEPSTLVLLCMGAFGFVLNNRRKRK